MPSAPCVRGEAQYKAGASPTSKVVGRISPGSGGAGKGFQRISG